MSINNEDLMLVNQSGVDYKTTAADLKAYLTSEPNISMPWDNYLGAVFHVKDATGTVTLNIPHDVYELDGTYKGQINTFGPGEEVVILVPPEETGSLFNDNTDTTWNFGELTDVSKARHFDSTFRNCNSFNGTGMSEWDTSKASRMILTFSGCSNFNQDLSQWCVVNVSMHDNFDYGCTSWQARNKPRWGTCPRGEDQ